jgi:hypothetical protein
MSTALITFAPPAGLPALMSQELLALAGKQDSGGINRISIKGSMFRFEKAGQEVQIMEDRKLDVAIVQISDFTSRSFYAGAYDPDAKNAAPDCSSIDGITPVATALSKQSTACASCPQNILGSKNVNGKAMRACTFKKRIVVVSPNQLQDGATEVTPFALDVNSISLFDDGKPNEQKFGLNAYKKWLLTQNAFPGAVVTRMSFDTDASVPKLFFSVASNSANQAAFLNAEQIKNLIALAKTDDVKKMMDSVGDAAPAGATASLPAPTAPLVPLIKPKTWQDVARENGADDDDIETLESRLGTPKFAVSWSKIVGDEVAVPGNSDVAIASSAPIAPPPALPKPKTWQEIATENGADADDIETIAEAGGPTTEKGKKRWDKTVGADVAYGAAPAPVAAKGKGKKKEAETPPVAATNPFVTPSVPVTAAAPAQPVSPIPASVGDALSAKLAAFDDE